MTQETFSGKKAKYVSPTERRELAKSLTRTHIRFNEKLEDMSTSHSTWFKPYQLEAVNVASIMSELNLVNANKPRLFLEKYSTIDYLDEKRRNQNYIQSAPLDQYPNHVTHNKKMREYEMMSHALKTPQPIKKPNKKVQTVRRNRMSLQEMAQNFPAKGTVKEINDTDVLRRILK